MINIELGKKLGILLEPLHSKKGNGSAFSYYDFGNVPSFFDDIPHSF